MSIASDIIAEVKPKFIQQGVAQGKVASLSEMLETFHPHLYDLYKDRLASVQTLEDYEELKTEIYKAMGSHQ